ncbi:FAD-binding oxidoreductase [Kamptonema animale CS-326]|jgi:glycolate oxidase FAD binding subunit|uniref:FAD-binding oxidoreductase n=1 Tax=Kamptonema animale TaxID=92934 RepID=UPI00233058C9|nr:FAD-binding oxidoreductase [Kamptonema animale]MDB9510293.1 FAD-binding oxidoreductase [Kamptonema animale CS-326]
MKSTLTDNWALAQELESIVGTDAVCPWQDTDTFWQKRIESAIAPGTEIDCTVYPHTQEELAAAIACISRNRRGVLPVGSGSKLDWGGLVRIEPPNPRDRSQVSEPALKRGKGGLVVVSCDRINRLIDRAVGDLTVTVEAGMKFAELQRILATSDQFLPLDPAYPEQATIGGIIATADAGSLRQRYRGVRDLLLGITFVRSDGKIAKAGGRVVKNVAGYDLMKLLTGSYGTLGIISQVTMRVYPLPNASVTVILTGEAEALANTTQTLLSSALTPTAVDLLSRQLVEKLGLGKNLGLAVRFQSIPESVEQQSSRLLEVGYKLGLKGTICADKDETNLWQRLKSIIWSTTPDSTIICKIGIIPSASVNILAQFNLGDGLIHGGSGLGILRFEKATVENILQLRQQCESQSGFLSILKAPADIKQQLDVWGYNGNALSLMQKIKQQFDPENILSPHRFLFP